MPRFFGAQRPCSVADTIVDNQHSNAKDTEVNESLCEGKGERYIPPTVTSFVR